MNLCSFWSFVQDIIPGVVSFFAVYLYVTREPRKTVCTRAVSLEKVHPPDPIKTHGGNGQ